MPTHAQEVRRQQVKRLLSQGAGPTEIAARLDCSRATVYRDLDAIAEEVQELKAGDLDEFLQDLKATFETVNTELWRVAGSTESERVKLRALKEIVHTNAAMVDVLKKVGVLDKVAEEIRFGSDHSALFKFIVTECNHDTIKGA